jgi:hypothetical protein
MSAGTALDEIPMSITNVDSPENITMQATNYQEQLIKENLENQQPPVQLGTALNNITNSPSISTDMKNKIITDLQRVSSQGGTALPSRDISMHQPRRPELEQEMVANHVPEPPQKSFEDYIQRHETQESVVKDTVQKKNKIDNAEYLYEELQTPVLIALLYFISQLPIINITLRTTVPYIFKADGNLKLVGHILKAMAFAGVYYTLILSLRSIETFIS